jgi:hypothetical protein
LALQREVKLGAREREEEEGVMVAGRGHDNLDIIPSHILTYVTPYKRVLLDIFNGPP